MFFLAVFLYHFPIFILKSLLKGPNVDKTEEHYVEILNQHLKTSDGRANRSSKLFLGQGYLSWSVHHKLPISAPLKIQK